jgi:hypothetical protein
MTAINLACHKTNWNCSNGSNPSSHTSETITPMSSSCQVLKNSTCKQKDAINKTAYLFNLPLLAFAWFGNKDTTCFCDRGTYKVGSIICDGRKITEWWPEKKTQRLRLALSHNLFLTLWKIKLQSVLHIYHDNIYKPASLDAHTGILNVLQTADAV